MEKRLIIACEMMRPELESVMEELGAEDPVMWMERGLHSVPKNLTHALSDALREAERVYVPDTVLLGYGFCGNAMAGVRAGNFRLILPRIDDCITMFIGSRSRKRQLESGVGTVFLTKGWIESDENILTQRQALIDDYGEEDGLELFDMMYGHYNRIGLLDTHCCPLAELEKKTRHVADVLGFEHKVFEGTDERLRQLLTGPWTEDKFVVKEPHEEITAQDLVIESQ
ncbi:MAG: DUF1638 domain-containing protein [Oscillospiraceae bacterium]|nr:DUF1638 domain-containing protein [Oscillospiraceae bacterium]